MVPGPALNERAPDFTLKTPDGRSEVTLSKIVGPKPVILVFGNYTCRPFRGQGGTLEKLYLRYKDRASFLAVYVREAHPTDGWRMEVNDVLGVAIRQPRTYAERAGVAEVCATTLGLSFPVLVDTLDDAVNNQYCGIPSRLYLIDADRRIAYKSGRGPFGFKPAEAEQSLEHLAPGTGHFRIFARPQRIAADRGIPRLAPEQPDKVGEESKLNSIPGGARRSE